MHASTSSKNSLQAQKLHKAYLFNRCTVKIREKADEIYAMKERVNI